MKLRSQPISGDAASFASLTEMGKDSSSAESRALIPGSAFHSDSWLVQKQPPDAHALRIEIPSCAKFAIYRCPGCNEFVDGGQLSEVLLHHQHVLDSYRIRIMGLDAVRTNRRANACEGLIALRRFSAIAGSLNPDCVFVRYKCAAGARSIHLCELGAKEQYL
jgi:hypothetical protein